MGNNTPRRIQMTRARPWRDRHPDAVIVDRRTKWGNPFKVGDKGVPDAKIAVVKFAAHLFPYSHNGPTIHGSKMADILISESNAMRIRDVLRGRDLACWCRLCDRHKDGLPLGEDCPDCEPCHADILLRVSNEGEKE